MTKPRLRMVHHLHRTGGTLISKCIASLPDVALLSEVHPQAPFQVLDPAFQASFWLRMFDYRTGSELEKATFTEKIIAIEQKASERGETLVLRNWAYYDFFGRPFVDQSSRRLEAVELLSDHFDLLHLATVRHPLDQLLSWQNYRGASSPDDFSMREILENAMHFYTATAAMPTVRYEDFVASPQTAMQGICKALDLRYDPVFLRRWPYYHQITGDDNDRASGDWKIAPRPRRAVPAGVLDELENEQAYHRLLSLYGYDSDSKLSADSSGGRSAS